MYTQEREGRFYKEICFSVLYASERGGIVWTFVKDNIIEEKEQYEYIGLSGFNYTLFEKDWGG